MRGKFGSEFEPKLAIMRQCTSVTDRRTDRQTDGLASWHKREMYILHLALKIISSKMVFWDKRRNKLKENWLTRYMWSLEQRWQIYQSTVVCVVCRSMTAALQNLTQDARDDSATRVNLTAMNLMTFDVLPATCTLDLTAPRCLSVIGWWCCCLRRCNQCVSVLECCNRRGICGVAAWKRRLKWACHVG